MNYIFVDLEMNPIAPQFRGLKDSCGSEIIEIGAVKLNENLKQISTFKQYVKPCFNDVITRKIQKLTGIDTETVSYADMLDVALQSFLDWCLEDNDEYSIYAWSESDLNQLVNEMYMKGINQTDCYDYMFEHWKDFQKEFGDALGANSKISLKNAVYFSDDEFEGTQHDALNDAHNTSRLFIKFRKDEKFRDSVDKVKKVLAPRKTFTVSIGDLFGAQFQQYSAMMNA